MSNAGYANLLAHLHNPSTPLPLPTIQSALAHYLATLSPLPTPLAASAVSAPLFAAHPVSHPRLQALSTAFRHAAHLKFRAAAGAEKNQTALGAVFSRGRAARLRQWARAVLTGLKGGQPILRLACAGGLLAGLEDLKNAEHLDVGRAQLEDELVIAVAESIDVYSAASAGGWEAEFQPKGDVDTMTLALILAAQALTLVVPRKLTALPLALLTDLLTATVASAFAAGSFLSSPSPSNSSSASSTGTSTLHAIAASPLMQHIAPLAKLTALSITILCASRPADGMRAAAAALGALRPLAARLEGDWAQGGGARAGADTQADAEPALVWTTLKTLLFATLMVADAALSAAVFVPPAVYASPHSSASPAPALFPPSHSHSYSHSYSDFSAVPTPATLAATLLHTLAHLAFVVSRFGGVTTAAAPGFVELKRTFYLALDVLAGAGAGVGENENDSERFVREVCADVHKWRQAGGDGDGDGGGDLQAKTAYALTCIEQLVPVLGGECIQAYALPLAIPYLSDAANRETYEASHSVVLAVFAAHAEQQQRARAAGADAHAQGQRSRFTERMVPFYARCLIENAADGMLSTAQLRLAFAALVRSASASAGAGAHSPGSGSGSGGEKNVKSSADGMLSTAQLAFAALVRGASANAGASAHSSVGERDLAERDTDEGYALAWYCVDALLGAIHALAAAGDDAERLHRLHLALISAVPSLPLALLPRVLEAIRAAVLTSARSKAKDLVDAAFGEIAERVGDREKELAMRWWYDNRSLFEGAGAGGRDEDAGLRIDGAREQQQARL